MPIISAMKILLLDTSSKFLSLAVAKDNRILRRKQKLLDRRHSAQLASLIDKILKKAGLSIKDIDGFCVSKGPGSFTGLRVGITAVKGLAYALRKPVVAIPTLDILAQNALKDKKFSKKLICPIVDARQNKVYACLYQSKNGAIKRQGRYLLLSLGELLRELKGEIFFLGDALSLYREQIRKIRGIKAVFANEKLWYPKISEAVPLALERFRKGKLDDVNSLKPLYLYPKECQIKHK